jgi:hypothetical protein
MAGNPGRRLDYRPLKQKANGQVSRKELDHRPPPHHHLPASMTHVTPGCLSCFDAIGCLQFNPRRTDFDSGEINQ